MRGLVSVLVVAAVMVAGFCLCPDAAVAQCNVSANNAAASASSASAVQQQALLSLLAAQNAASASAGGPVVSSTTVSPSLDHSRIGLNDRSPSRYTNPSREWYFR